MTPTTLGIGLGLFILLSFTLVRRAMYVYRSAIYPFQIHIHTPAAMEALPEKEHDELHDKLDLYALRMIGCTIAAWVGTITGLFAFAMVLYGGAFGVLGYVSLFAFSFILANLTLNGEIVKWIVSAENDIFTRIVKRNAEAGGFGSLREYLLAENDKLLKEQAQSFSDMIERGVKMMEEFEKVMVEVGIDLDKNYEATEKDFEEFKRLLALAEAKMEEKHPELSERPWKQADKL